MSFFSLAARCCGLHLKHCKCVIIVSGIELTDQLGQLIQNWLAQHAPAFKDFEVASSGKYLGWFLGRESVQRSFVAPHEQIQ